MKYIPVTENSQSFFEKKFSKEMSNILSGKIDKVLLKEHPVNFLHNYKEWIDLIKKNENNSIMILWDFDADWITSTSILAIWLRSILKNAIIRYIVPERDDSHGLNKVNVQKAIDNWSKLIITCDNWSNDLELIDYAHKNWLDVIVTDHHTIENDNHLKNYPLINSIVKDAYPCTYLCWAWIVYKLIIWLANEYKVTIPDMELEKIKMLTTIWTIADKVKLHDENLFFVLNFKKYFKNPKSKVMKSIIDALEYTEKDWSWFWFKICPLFNVAGRLWKSNQLINFIVEWEKYENIDDFTNYFLNLNEKRKVFQAEWSDYIKSNNLLQKTKYLNLVKHKDLPSWINRLIANEFAEWKISMSCNIKDWIVHCSVMNHLNVDVLKFLKWKNYTTNAWWHFKAFWYSYKLKDEELFFKELNNYVEKNKEKIYDFHEENSKVNINDMKISVIKEMKSFIWSSWIEEPIFEDELEIRNIALLKWKHLKITFIKDWKSIDWIKWNYNKINEYSLWEIKKISFSYGINEWMGKTKKQIFFN